MQSTVIFVPFWPFALTSNTCLFDVVVTYYLFVQPTSRASKPFPSGANEPVRRRQRGKRRVMHTVLFVMPGCNAFGPVLGGNWRPMPRPMPRPRPALFNFILLLFKLVFLLFVDDAIAAATAAQVGLSRIVGFRLCLGNFVASPATRTRCPPWCRGKWVARDTRSGDWQRVHLVSFSGSLVSWNTPPSLSTSSSASAHCLRSTKYSQVPIICHLGAVGL